ncbi:cytochrome P450 [Paenibacillus sp. GYB003]|uniref:cytochrome P450 n=1 Tax=Paenibacillus sp. GYB003 TaxID=2994392 RepID=UPI002F963ABC
MMSLQTFPFNPKSSAFLQDRHAVFKEMRAHSLIYKESETDIGGRPFTRWHFTTYEDVMLMFRDKRFVTELKKVLPAEQIPPVPEDIRALDRTLKNVMLYRDPPDHTRLRSLVNKAFTPRIAEQLEPRIREISSHLLNGFEPGATFDLVRNFSFPLPVIVIAELLGSPVEDRDLIKDWSAFLTRTIDYKPSKETLVKGNQAALEFRDYCRGLVEDRSRNPKDDLLSELIRATHEGDRMSVDELLDMCILILEAGHETTMNLLANSVYLMTQYPEQQTLLRAQPKWMESAIEEILRFEPPAHLRHRTVGEDIEYKGHMLKRGDLVSGWIVSANRDPEVFFAPDSFDITRDKNPHLSFGQGIHFCLGAPLARKEGMIALQTLLDKYSRLDRVHEQVEWISYPGKRYLKELIIHAK